jgi:hypothetical protein
MMEVPNIVGREFMMDFKKFAQSLKKLMYSEEKVYIKGSFREKGDKEIFSGDNFLANKVWKSGEDISAEFIYKVYLEWFNRTLIKGEKEREFVSAEITTQDEETMG